MTAPRTAPPARPGPGGPPEPLKPRVAYREALLRLAARDERVVCLDSDTGGLENTFAARFPDRYFNIGIAEANMLGIAAGLAARGYIPYTHTMATFATLRAGEHLKLDVAGHGLPVRIVATHGGLSAAHFGTSHFALEDLAVVRALNGITAVVPADAAEIGPALEALHDLPSPVYLRLGRDATPHVHDPLRPPDFRLGRAVTLREGRDVALVACGPHPVLMALEAARSLASVGVSCRVLQIHTLVPLDADAVRAAAAATGALVTVEEHRPQGGLGDAVAEAVGGHRPVPHIRIAVGGRVGVVVRGHREALEAAGLSASAIHRAALHVIATGEGE
jgi:transketolase